MRVLIADDSAFMRRMLTRLLESSPTIEVVGTARNGAEAVAKCAELNPDVVTMDVEMPVMDGLEALKRIRAAHGPVRPAVLVCSTMTDTGSKTALDALRLGAADVIAKEDIGVSEASAAFRHELMRKIRAVGARSREAMAGAGTACRSASAHPASGGERTARAVPSSLAVRPGAYEVVAIGSSTGGPPVLELILRSLPSVPSKPILIAQHMPPLFTRSLASRLNEVGPARVVLAEDGETVESGTVYIAEGGKHLRLRGTAARMVLEVSPSPDEAFYKPSVNELFASLGRVVGTRAFAAMLTGMGDDGLEGSRELVGFGSRLVAQNEESCVVYGMPRVVTESGLASASLSPDAIAAAVASAAGCVEAVVRRTA